MKRLKQNIPNIITISRMIASITASGLFITGNVLPSVILYIYGGISDFFDGLAARKLNATTELGKKLDPISDKIYALSLLTPSIVLGNYLMLLPLIMEGEISSTVIAGKNTNINMETEKVGKYKTWFLFTSLILGLLATKFPVAYFPLALSLGYTTHFQLQSLKAYNNQYIEKVNDIKQVKEIEKEEQKEKNEQVKERKEIKNIAKDYYNEFIYYKDIEVSKPKTLVKKR